MPERNAVTVAENVGDQARIIANIGTYKVEPTQRGLECCTTGLAVTVRFILEGIARAVLHPFLAAW